MTWLYGKSITFSKPQRDVSTVYLHCSATDNPAHDSVEVINQWHQQRGFDEIGYHYFISKNGDIHTGRSLEKTPAAQKGNNTGSIAICLHGLKKDKFTEQQYEAITQLCTAINAAYRQKMRFRGHTEVAAKSCPVFDYRTVLGLDKNGYIDPRNTAAPRPDNNNATATRDNVLALFSSGEAVRNLQQWLNDVGINTFVDGDYGQGTRRSVSLYQQKSGLYVDGKVGMKTKASMALVKRGSSGEAAKVVQHLLNNSGFSLVKDGDFGDASVVALMKFQAFNDLTEDGIAGTGTRKVLMDEQRVEYH